MKKVILFSCLMCLAEFLSAQAKTEKEYRNFPLILTVQFHSLTLPFKDIKSNFCNVGIGLGTEVSFNGYQNWVQQFNIGWIRNKTTGNGWLLSTQTVWRPAIADDFFAELKIGVGYKYNSRPVESYKQENGQWVAVGQKGKGMLVVPVGFSVGYNGYSPGTYFSPFVSYQLLVLKGYNTSVPIVPETLLQTGTRVHF
ncbi:MAG TPA: hypothetical protein VJ765_09080 [Chitinophagaceae bacterium]|nr:hypothetical protein [Chitinophagaceae bacterium]